MQKVDSKDGTHIAFDRTGDGLPLILVAGATATRTMAAPTAEYLATHFTVFTCDRCGRADSGDATPYAVAREIEDLTAIIDEASGSALVFGHSSGAVLALRAAGQLPSKIKKLAIYEPPYQQKAVATLAKVLPNAQYRSMAGQGHGIAPEVLGPALVEFF